MEYEFEVGDMVFPMSMKRPTRSNTGEVCVCFRRDGKNMYDVRFISGNTETYFEDDINLVMGDVK